MAQVTGISLSQLRRLERRELEHPPLAYFVNCAIALGVDLDEILDEKDRAWTSFDKSLAPIPPPKNWYEREEQTRPKLRLR